MIRALSLDELDHKIPSVGAAFFKEAGLPGVFNAHTYTRMWRGLYEAGTGIIYEAESDGKACGWIGGVVVPEHLTGESIGMETFWYALPEHRGLGAIKLLKRFEQWVKERGANRLWMVHLTKINPDKMACFYKRSGYDLLEHFYMKNL